MMVMERISRRGRSSSVYRAGLLSLCFLCVFLFTAVAWSDNAVGVVLITHQSSNIKTLSLLEIRRLYLGFPVSNKHVNRPVINRFNEKLYGDFLKNVMHMTEDGYKRKIVRRVFKYGADYIKELSSLEDIADHLRTNPNDVVFVNRENISKIEDAKVVARLW